MSDQRIEGRAIPYGKSHGHGHVTPNPDGSKARCGGPRLCKVCRAEEAALQRERTSAVPIIADFEKQLADVVAYAQTHADPHTARYIRMRLQEVSGAFYGALVKPEQCDPENGIHVTPHRGCILR